MKHRFLQLFLLGLVALLASAQMHAANLTYTWADTPLHGSYACTYYNIDTETLAAALGTTSAELQSLFEAKDANLKLGTYESDGTSVTTSSDAGEGTYSGFWMNAEGKHSGWSSGSFYFVYNPEGKIGIGQMPTTETSKKHCEPGITYKFSVVFQYNDNQTVVDINYLTTYKLTYENAVKSAQEALSSSDYAAVTGAPRANLESLVNASVEQTEEAWKAAADKITAAISSFSSGVTGAGSYSFVDSPLHNSFACTYFDIDNEPIAKILGLSVADFTTNYKPDNSGKVTMSTYDTSNAIYTASNDAGEGNFRGYWMNKAGRRSGFSTGSIYFVYDPAGRIGIGQMATTQNGKAFVNAGDTITFPVIFQYDGKMATVDVAYCASFSKWLQSLVEATPNYDDLSTDTYVTTAMLEAYKTLRADAATKYETVSSEDEVNAVYKPLKEAADSLETNISLWKDYKKQVDKANKEVLEDEHVKESDAMYELEDYISTAESKLAEPILTNDELRGEIKKLEDLIKTALNAGVTAGADITDKYLVNADFETSKSAGWTQEGNNINYGGSSINHCMEASNSGNFDVYQTLTGMPVGVYTIKVNGFYRYGNGSSSLTYYEDGTAAQHKDAVKVYVNDNTAFLPNVYDEKVAVGTDYTEGNAIKDASETYWYPNNMNDAATAFSNGRYSTSIYGVVAKASDALRIGVKGNTSVGTSWAIWDNFQVVYEGTEQNVVQPLLQSKVSDIQTLLANGAYSTDAVAKAKEDIAAANAATDGETMFNVLCSLINDQTALNESAQRIATLATKTSKLNENISHYAEIASDESLTAAKTVYGEVTAHLSASDMTSEQVETYIVKVSEASTKVRMPAGYASATQENPADFTTVIDAPGFEDANGTNSFDGWTEIGDSHSFGNSDYQRNALLVEYHKTFDLNQTICGLPDGQYRLTVNCFSRYGSLSNDNAVYTDHPETLNNAYMYAVNGGDTTKTYVAFVSSGAYENAGISGQTSINGKNVPNDMASAGQWFNNGYYLNKLTLNVKGGVLTIGLRKYENISDDWLILDNWTLEYLGAAAAAGIGSISDNHTGKIVSTEVYDATGVRRTGLQRGMNLVKTTDEQGKTSVRKVIVK